MNQDRFIFYFSDEFGSVATTGNDTGEADVMDKVREFKCGFMLGFQSFAILKKKLSPPRDRRDHDQRPDGVRAWPTTIHSHQRILFEAI